jgi:hypothetical protein
MSYQEKLRIEFNKEFKKIEAEYKKLKAAKDDGNVENLVSCAQKMLGDFDRLKNLYIAIIALLNLEEEK